MSTIDVLLVLIVAAVFAVAVLAIIAIRGYYWPGKKRRKP